MTIKTENWLGEYTSTIGTGDITLGGAIDGFAGFSNVGENVDVYYTVMDALDKETGIGTLTGGKLVRKDIHATLVDGAYVKNGSAINLSGDAQVYGTVNAHFLDYVQAVANAEIVNTQAIAELKALQINGHALTASFNLTAADVGAHPDNWMPSTEALNVYHKDASDIRYLKTQDAEQVAGLVMRVGGSREQQLQQSIDGLESRIDEALRRSYAEAGYNLVDGSFEAGGTLVNANDVLLQERTGKAFAGPAGTVAAGTNPASGGFVDKSGTSASASAISNANGGSVQDFIDTTESELATIHDDITHISLDVNDLDSRSTANISALQTQNATQDNRLNAVESGQGAGVIGYDTQANLFANRNFDDGSIGYVTNDTTATKNGTYRKSGARGTGSWIQSSADLASQAYQLSTSNADVISRDYTDIAITEPTVGSYVNRSGGISYNAGFIYKSIPVLAGETYFIQGYINSAARIFKANGSVYPTSDAPVTNTRYGNFVYIKSDGNLEVSFVKALPYSVQKVNTLAELPSVVNQLVADISGVSGQGGTTEKSNEMFKTLDYTITKGYYLQANGNLVPLAGWGYTDISVTKGDVIYIKGSIADSARLYSLNGKTYPETSPSGFIDLTEFVVVSQSGTMRISFVLNKYYEIKKIALSGMFEPQSSELLNDIEKVQYTANPGFYLSKFNDKRALASYTYGEITVSAGDVIKISGWIDDAARLISINGELYPKTMGANGIYEFEIVALSNELVRFGHKTAQPFSIKKNKTLKGVGEAIAETRSNLPVYEEDKTHLSSFHKVMLCAGDSLTSGGNYQPPLNGQAIEECYPYFLNRISKWKTHCQARNGINPQNYWTDYSPIIDGSLYDGVILWLGTNGGLTDTLAADTVSGDFNTYANTGTGRYCSIVEKLLTENSKLTIYLTHIYAASGSTVAISNDVINQIQAKYSALGYRVFVMEPDVDFMKDPAWHEYNTAHFTKMGNEAIANHFYEKIIGIIADNRKDYDTVDRGLRVSNYFDN